MLSVSPAQATNSGPRQMWVMEKYAESNGKAEGIRVHQEHVPSPKRDMLLSRIWTSEAARLTLSTLQTRETGVDIVQD